MLLSLLLFNVALKIPDFAAKKKKTIRGFNTKKDFFFLEYLLEGDIILCLKKTQKV